MFNKKMEAYGTDGVLQEIGMLGMLPAWREKTDEIMKVCRWRRMDAAMNTKVTE